MKQVFFTFCILNVLDVLVFFLDKDNERFTVIIFLIDRFTPLSLVDFSGTGRVSAGVKLAATKNDLLAALYGDRLVWNHVSVECSSNCSGSTLSWFGG